MFSTFSLPRFRLTSRLSLRLFWYAALCSAIFTLLVSAIQLWLSYQHDLDSIERDMQFIQASYLPSLNRSLYELDGEQLRLQLSGLLQFQHIAYVEIIAKEEHVGKFSAGNFSAEQDIVRAFPLEYPNVRHKGQNLSLGTLTVTITLHGVHTRLMKNAVLILCANAAQIFLTAFMLLVIIHVLITRHLIAMASYTSSLDIHQLEGVFALHRSHRKHADVDELDMVVAALNDLQARLRSDIMRRLRAEERLRKMYAELEMRVQQRTEELTQANRELHHTKEIAEHANRSKTLFLANMSHELRTPLNVILGYTQILEQEERLSEQEQKAIETIHHSGRHLLQMIDDLLDLSKIDAQKIDVQLKEVAFQAFLHDIADMMQIRAYQKQLNFTTDFAPDLPPGILIDEHRLRQVLLNLSNNAVKYTEEGMITFRVHRIAGEAPQHASESAFAVTLRFEILDTGIGIPADKIGHIFDAFYQIDTGDAHIEGSGLGLAISRSLVRMMGGELLVNSTVKQGSLFWFDLSVTALPMQTPESIGQMRRIIGYTGERRTVFVVDDDQQNLAVMRDMLTPLDFRVNEAANGRIALEQIRRLRPDMLFLDIIMPEMDGIEVAQRLRQFPELDQMPIIAVSASISGRHLQKSLEVGCNGFLSKPIYLDNLFKTLQQYLHVEWVYEERNSPHSSLLNAEEPIGAIPPREDLLPLFEAAQARNITAIKKWLDMFQHDQTQYQAFLLKMQFYTTHYQFNNIVELLAPYLRRTHP